MCNVKTNASWYQAEEATESAFKDGKRLLVSDLSINLII
jgi:hypothetical protein